MWKNQTTADRRSFLTQVLSGIGLALLTAWSSLRQTRLEPSQDAPKANVSDVRARHFNRRDDLAG